MGLSYLKAGKTVPKNRNLNLLATLCALIFVGVLGLLGNSSGTAASMPAKRVSATTSLKQACRVYQKDCHKRVKRFEQSRASIEARLVSAVVKHADTSLVRAGHASSPLRSELRGIVLASKREDVSPFFILSITGKESTFGVNVCGKNAWGWNGCSTNDWSSFSEGAREVAYYLRVNYMQKWGKRSILDIGNTYCSGCGYEWAKFVRYSMKEIFSSGEGLRWKDAVQTVS